MAGKSLHQRVSRSSSDEVRERILNAAAREFATFGFEGASTRKIAEQSQVHQAQIGYHIGTKDDLWRATVDYLFARLRSNLDRALPANLDERVDDAVEVFANVIRWHVRHTSKYPELSRIMLMESAHKSERVSWLLKNHVRPTFAALELVWSDVIAAGKGRSLDAEDVFMIMIGVSPMPFAQSGIMRPLLGTERCTPDSHAEAMIRWILG